MSLYHIRPATKNRTVAFPAAFFQFEDFADCEDFMLEEYELLNAPELDAGQDRSPFHTDLSCSCADMSECFCDDEQKEEYHEDFFNFSDDAETASRQMESQLYMQAMVENLVNSCPF